MNNKQKIVKYGVNHATLKKMRKNGGSSTVSTIKHRLYLPSSTTSL